MKQKLIALLGWLLSRLNGPQQPPPEPPAPNTDHLSEVFDRFIANINAGTSHPITALIRAGAANLPAEEFDTFFVMVEASRRRDNPFKELLCFSKPTGIPFPSWILFIARSAWNAEFEAYTDLEYLDFISKILNPGPIDRTVDEHFYSKKIHDLDQSWRFRTNAESWSGTPAWKQRCMGRDMEP